MSQTAHKSRTTHFIYRFDMNSTFDLSDLSCLSKALKPIFRSADEAPFRRPSMVRYFPLPRIYLDVPDSRALGRPSMALRHASLSTRRILPQHITRNQVYSRTSTTQALREKMLSSIFL